MLYLESFNTGTEANPQVSDQEFLRLFQDYVAYKKDTLEGKHGKTAQVFLMYVKLIDYYLMMDYSIRAGDIEL